DALVFRGVQIKADQVFIVFGYALVTTSCGMFLRLLVLQFQQTLPDQVVEARDAIDQRVKAVTEELGRCQEAISNFRSLTVASLKQWTSDVTETSLRAQKTIEQVHAESARLALEQVRASAKSLSDEFGAVQP